MSKKNHAAFEFRANEYVVYPAHGVGKIVTIEKQEIAGTALDPVYQSQRYNWHANQTLTARLPVAPGRYGVRLHFAETYGPMQGTGLRRFDIRAEGALILNRINSDEERVVPKLRHETFQSCDARRPESTRAMLSRYADVADEGPLLAGIALVVWSLTKNDQ